ncbi:hypothetical protein ACIPSJ_01655 [Streptomyces sp. NPDC090088]|uniref:hypothetical protein n=1 Tax=Streptomyces sp. NPDC090088 TaxID=3365944 RepID=UPI0037F121D7
MTRTHRAVLTAIASTDRPTDLAIHEATGYGPDRIYRALHMLQQAGWIRVRTDAPTAAAEDAWSIYYHLTDRGLRGAGLHTKDSTA